jgi:DNA invertase Pin-like site-specific DNA recombinase
MSGVQILPLKAIVYCRLSRVGNSGVVSLSSQEFAIERYLETQGLGVFKTFKDIGSAFKRFKKGDKIDLKRVLSSFYGKDLVVYEANRLSRNVHNFKEIYDLCTKHRHNIRIVVGNMFFDCRTRDNYRTLYDLIIVAQTESENQGRRVSRTRALQRSQQPDWGLMRNDRNELIENVLETRTSRLINLLHTAGSSIEEIQTLMEQVRQNHDVEPLEFVEIEREENDMEVNDDITPSGMTIAEIVRTFQIYGVRKRRAAWTATDVGNLLAGRLVVNNVLHPNVLANIMGVVELDRS